MTYHGVELFFGSVEHDAMVLVKFSEARSSLSKTCCFLQLNPNNSMIRIKYFFNGHVEGKLRTSDNSETRPRITTFSEYYRQYYTWTCWTLSDAVTSVIFAHEREVSPV